MDDRDKEERLMDDLESMIAEYKDHHAAVVVLGTLGAAINEGKSVALAELTYRWFERNIKLKKRKL